MDTGYRLRALRESLNLTLRDVEAASKLLAQKYGNSEFALPLSRLSDFETRGLVVSIHRLYSLSVIYHKDIREILGWYGVELGNVEEDLRLVAHCKTRHQAESIVRSEMVRMPLALDPGFDPAHTTNLGRMIEKWGVVPLNYLQKFENTDYTYGYVGTEDFTLYPLILPGSFVQVDNAKTKINSGNWRSEYERPIYFVETREGFVCAWCSMQGGNLILQPHPLSPVNVRALRHPTEAEIIGQVVGIAMRLDEWKTCEPERVLPQRAFAGQKALN